MNLKSLAGLSLAVAAATTVIGFISCNPVEPTPANTAPVFASGYPKVDSADGANIPLMVLLNEAATIYFIALPAGNNAPEVFDVMDGVDNSGTAVAATHKGTFSAAANTPTSYNMPINDGRSYDVYVVAADAGGLTTLAPKVAVVASGDAPPSFATGYPAVSGDAGSITNVLVNVSKPGMVYAVGVPSGDNAPAASQVKAGKDAGGTAAAATGSATVLLADDEVTVSICGFGTSTAYDIYVAAEDTSGNIGLSPTPLTIATGANPSAAIKVYGDDSVVVSINGVVVPSPGGITTASVTTGDNCVGLTLINGYDQWGGAVIGSVSWDCGANSVMTDGTWKYSFSAETGWDQPGFDASTWFTARVLNDSAAQVPQAANLSTLDEPRYSLDNSATARWLWSGPNYYYRKNITTAAGTATIKVCGEQIYSFYVDGELLVDNDTTYLVGLSLTKELTAGSHCFAAVATDSTKGAWGGNFIMDLQVGGEVFITDSSWKFSVVEETGWNTAAFDDANWISANDLGDYVLRRDGATSPVMLGDWTHHWLKSTVFGPARVGTTKVPASTAHWIGGAYTIYFRKEFTVQ